MCADVGSARSTHAAIRDERNKDVQICINGEFFHRSEAKLSVFDSGFLVGDGLWEGELTSLAYKANCSTSKRLSIEPALINYMIGLCCPQILCIFRHNYATVFRIQFTHAILRRHMCKKKHNITPSGHMFEGYELHAGLRLHKGRFAFLDMLSLHRLNLAIQKQ